MHALFPPLGNTGKTEAGSWKTGEEFSTPKIKNTILA
jgi:hypothetical protein